MKIAPKYPPQKSCRLAPGTRVKVVEGFTAFGVDFTKGEELVFEGEMVDVYDDCDAWIFSAPPVAGRKLPEKVILGYEKFSDPKDWLRRFSVVGD